MYQQLTPISSQRHRGKRFAKARDVFYAKEVTLLEVVAEEMGQALTSFPLCFHFQNEQPILGALFSLVPGRNLLVLPDGRWAGAYMPAMIRSWPFALHCPPGETKAVICIDEGALSEDDTAEILYDEAGEPGETLANALKFMEKYAANLKATRDAALALHQAGVLVPWELKLAREGKTENVRGVWRADEAALKALDPEVLSSLCSRGALGMAYAQLLSVGRMGKLQQAAKVHLQADKKQQELDEQVADLFGEDDTLKFDF